MTAKEFIHNNYDMLLNIFNTIKVGIWITDSNGKVIMVNNKSVGDERDEIMGKTMKELMETGYILDDSSVLKAMESKREESIIQEWGEGMYAYATSVPLMKGQKKEDIDILICTERNITETINLRALIRDKEKLANQYESELQYLRQREFKKNDIVITQNIAMQNILETVDRMAKLDVTIMITGESGTGKELISNLIYESSDRKGKPFIKINCAAIPESLMESEFFGYEKGAFTGANKDGKAGYFEMANNGTLFLDEIGELSLQMQSKLLRAIQEKEIMRIGAKSTIAVNIRIVVATNRNLKEEIKKGRFREDLYYRLNIIIVDLIPLRERKEDIEILTDHFIKTFNKEYGMNKRIGKDAVTALLEYSWPGNIRELRNLIERIAVGSMGNTITGYQIRMQLNNFIYDKENFVPKENQITLEAMVEEFERDLIVKVLENAKTITKTANMLGVNKSTISRKCKKYGITEFF